MSHETNTRYIGLVKWFNNKAGFGFITMIDDTQEGDVFVHHSTIKVKDSQYKYLVQGEYVEFELSSSSNQQHQYQATSVTGIQKGPLMCETIQLNRTQKRGPESEGFSKVQPKRKGKVTKP
jgi:cold shock CspA family protein